MAKTALRSTATGEELKLARSSGLAVRMSRTCCMSWESSAALSLACSSESLDAAVSRASAASLMALAASPRPSAAEPAMELTSPSVLERLSVMVWALPAAPSIWSARVPRFPLRSLS